MPEQNCKDCCSYYHKNPSTGWGQCRLKPPRVFQEIRDGAYVYVTRFPFVHPDFFCDEFDDEKDKENNDG